MSNNNKIELKFNVSSFRKIPNPYLRSENLGETKPEMYVLICDAKDIQKISQCKLILECKNYY